MPTRNEPGVFIPYTEVEKILTDEMYGIFDLVDLGLFHSYSSVRSAMKAGRLAFKKINERAYVLSRTAILEYWEQYRKEPYSPAINSLKIYINLQELDYVCTVLKLGQDKFDKRFTIDDLFRNVIKKMKEQGTEVFEDHRLFIHHEKD